MSLTEKLEEVQAVYKNIFQLLYALPIEDSQSIQKELDNYEVEDKLNDANDEYRQLLSNTEILYKQLNTFHSELLKRLSVQRLVTRQHSYKPVLTSLMDMIPDDVEHTDIVWVRRWLVNPEPNLDEAKYFFIYSARAAAEALAIKCHVLKDQWEQIFWDLIPLFEAFFKQWDRHTLSMITERWSDNLGFVSHRFNRWIICVVGDPEKCPNLDIRFKILFMYKLLKIDDENYRQAFSSVFSVFTSLNRHQESIAGEVTQEIDEFFSRLNHGLGNKYFNKLDQELAEELRHHRNTRKLILIRDISNEYAMGLKIATNPQEINGLIAILKYISGRSNIYYDGLQEDPNNIRHLKKIYETLRILDTLVCNFKATLEEPEMLSVAAECIMNTMENAVLSIYKQFLIANGDLDDVLMPFHLIFTELDVLLYKDYDDIGHGPVGKEIIRRYKERICRLRLQIPKNFLMELTHFYNYIQ